MRHYDFSPLYRSSIGFDRVANLLDSMVGAEQVKPAYPPYNIEQKSDDEYRITMAVAGFDQSELTVEAEQNKLTITGKKSDKEDDVNYLHRGIAARNFERRFELADHVRIESATYKNGLLHIDLLRELPEVMKPRTIAIQSEQAQENDRTATKLEQVKQNAA